MCVFKKNDLKFLKVKSVAIDETTQLSKVVRGFGKMSGNSIWYYQVVHRIHTDQKYEKHVFFSI